MPANDVRRVMGGNVLEFLASALPTDAAVGKRIPP